MTNRTARQTFAAPAVLGLTAADLAALASRAGYASPDDLTPAHLRALADAERRREAADRQADPARALAAGLRAAADARAERAERRDRANRALSLAAVVAHQPATHRPAPAAVAAEPSPADLAAERAAAVLAHRLRMDAVRVGVGSAHLR